MEDDKNLQSKERKHLLSDGEISSANQEQTAENSGHTAGNSYPVHNKLTKQIKITAVVVCCASMVSLKSFPRMLLMALH